MTNDIYTHRGQVRLSLSRIHDRRRLNRKNGINKTFQQTGEELGIPRLMILQAKGLEMDDRDQARKEGY